MKRILILIGCLSVAGCLPHLKDLDSYNTLFRNDEIKQMPGKGDPYTFGGIGEGSGGQAPRQTYATDAKDADFRDATETGKRGAFDKDRTRTKDVPAEGSSVGTVGMTDGEPRIFVPMKTR